MTSRREVLALLSFVFVRALLPEWAAADSMGVPDAGGVAGSGNFKIIYGNPELKGKFVLFLKNVFNLYPEEKFHHLIESASLSKAGDAEAYAEILKRLPEITPMLSQVTYALPALKKQKEEIASQTAKLLHDRKSINGYIEIGTPGRYVRALGKKIELKGKVFLVHDKKPDFGINDVVERGQIRRAGDYVPLADYKEWSADQLKSESVDVVTNFIGLHHSPPENLDGFVRSIHRVLKPGGVFILRDHDAHSSEMAAMVGLAHDVFNAGLKTSWETNAKEIRHFKSLKQIEAYLAPFGFERQGEFLFQEGDPTKNALMRFLRKV